MKFVDRVAAEATKVKPSKMLLSLLALPFYVIGLLLGVVLVSMSFMVAGVKLGVADTRRHLDRNDGAARGAD